MMELRRELGRKQMVGRLSIIGIDQYGRIEDFGLVSEKCITDAWAELLVDTLQSSVPAFSTFKYHDSGTGTNGEDPTDVGLQTPCGEARTVGSQGEGATANIYKSIGLHTYAGNFSITEHGLFNASSGVTLLDRSVFTAKPVTSGYSLQFIYELTITSGG